MDQFEAGTARWFKGMAAGRRIASRHPDWFGRALGGTSTRTISHGWGEPIIQFPQDVMAMQEIIWGTKPDFIIETGIARGGSLILSAFDTGDDWRRRPGAWDRCRHPGAQARSHRGTSDSAPHPDDRRFVY